MRIDMMPDLLLLARVVIAVWGVLVLCFRALDRRYPSVAPHDGQDAR